MAEEYTEYEEMQKRSHPVLKAVLKGILIALIVFVFGAVLIRSCVRQPQKLLLASPELAAASADGRVRILYQSPYDKINRNEYGTFQFAVSDCFYIPATKQLQVTVRYNKKTLQDTKDKYGLTKLPEDDCFAFSLLFDDGQRLTSHRYSTATRGRYIFVYLLFDGVDLEEYTPVAYTPADAAVTDREGNIVAHETDENGRSILYETDESGSAKVYVRTYVSLETYYSEDVNYNRIPLSSLLVFDRLYSCEELTDSEIEKYLGRGNDLPLFNASYDADR